MYDDYPVSKSMHARCEVSRIRISRLFTMILRESMLRTVYTYVWRRRTATAKYCMPKHETSFPFLQLLSFQILAKNSWSRSRSKIEEEFDINRNYKQEVLSFVPTVPGYIDTTVQYIVFVRFEKTLRLPLRNTIKGQYIKQSFCSGILRNHSICSWFVRTMEKWRYKKLLSSHTPPAHNSYE